MTAMAYSRPSSAVRALFAREAGSFIWFILAHRRPCAAGVLALHRGRWVCQSFGSSREVRVLCAELVSELVFRRAAQRVVSVERLRSQARGVLEVTQLIVEVALQTGAVLALEIRQLIDRTLQRRL